MEAKKELSCLLQPRLTLTHFCCQSQSSRMWRPYMVTLLKIRGKWLWRGSKRTSFKSWWQLMLHPEALIFQMWSWSFSLSHLRIQSLTFTDLVGLLELENQELASRSSTTKTKSLWTESKIWLAFVFKELAFPPKVIWRRHRPREFSKSWKTLTWKSLRCSKSQLSSFLSSTTMTPRWL